MLATAVAAAMVLVALPPAAVANTSLSTAGCTTPGALQLPPSTGTGGVVTSEDCVIGFGSDDATARLRAWQADRGGSAMFRDPLGALDPDLGTAGVFAHDETTDEEAANAVVALPDGSIVAVGLTGAADAPIIVKLAADGQPDLDFGSAGVATFDPSAGTDMLIDAIAQPDGRLLVVGTVDFDVAVLRIDADGTLDPTFGGGDGVATVDLGALELGTGIALQRDGRIIVAGARFGGSGFVLRLDADGSRDQDGFAAPRGIAWIPGSNGTNFPRTAVAADGDVLVAATSSVGDSLVARYTPAGVADTSFAGGVATIDYGAAADLSSIAVQDDGVLVAASDATGSYLTRLRADGTPDPDFAGGGTRPLDLTGLEETVTKIAVESTGHVVASFITGNGTAAGDGGIARLLPDGADDTTFSGDGWYDVVQAGAAEDHLRGIAVGQDGRIVAAGARRVAGSDWELTIVRLAGAALPDYGSGGTFDTGTATFGACLRDVQGLGAVATWSMSATCPATDGAWWNPIPAAGGAGSQVAASTTAGVVNATASLRFGARADAGSAAGRYHAPIVVEVLAPNLDPPANTAAPTITGTAQVRKVLTAATGTWTGSPTIAYAHQWQRCTPACADIPGATGSTYALAPADEAATIRVVVTATNGEGSVAAASAETGPVAPAAPSSVVYMTGFEHQTASTSGGGIADTLNGGGTSVATTSNVHSGVAAMRFTAPASNREWINDIGSGITRAATARVYVHVERMPDAEVTITDFATDSGAYCEINLESSGQLFAEVTGGPNVYGATLQEDRWYLIEQTCDVSGATWTVDWRVDGVAQPPATRGGMSPDWVVDHYFGIDVPTTGILVFDDVAVSTSIADYPLGPAQVLAHRPDGIGAISNPAQWNWSTDDGGAVTAFGAGDQNQSPGRSTLVDDWPVTSGAGADLIEQTVTGDTLEVRVADSDEPSPPTAISIVGAQRGKATGTNDATLTAVSGASTQVWSTDPAGDSATLQYFAGVLDEQPSGGAWTDAAFDSLVLQLSSSDAGPAIWTDALLVEAEYPASGVAASTAPPTITGTPKVGATLTVGDGEWTPDPTAFAYQWRRCNASGGACVDVAGATSNEYVAAAPDAGGTLRVVVTASTSAGNQTATSAATTPVTSANPTLAYLTGFEHGTASTAGGGLFSSLSGAASVDTTTLHRNGRGSLRVASTGGSDAAAAVSYASSSVVVARFAVMFEELPTSDGEIAEISIGSGWSCDLDYVANRFSAGLSVDQPSTMTVEPWRWYVIDMRCDASSGTRRIDWRVDGVPQAQVADAMAASTSSTMTLGSTGSTLLTGTVRYDDWAISRTSADYPLGAGRVHALTPSGTGIHTMPGNFDQSTDGGGSWTTLTSGDDNQLPGSAALLDDWPIDHVAGSSGGVVRQSASVGHLLYGLRDPGIGGPVNAVRMVGAHHSGAPAATQDTTVRTRLGASTSTAYSQEVASGAVSYRGGILTTRPGGGAWTGADLDALQVELDSTNVGAVTSERPWTIALLAEADAPVGAMPTNTSAPGIALPFDVPKEGDELTAVAGEWGGEAVHGHRYTWLRCNTAGGACTVVATGPTYVLQAGDVGARMRVVDQAIGDAGAQGAVSAPTELVSTQPTYYFLTGFEHGVASVDGGGLMTQIDPVATIDSTLARTGGYSMRADNTGGGGAEWEWDTTSGADPVGVARFAFHYDAPPASTATIMEVAGAGRFGRMRLSPAGQLSVDFYDGSPQAQVDGATITPGRWYVIDMRVDGTSTTWTFDWRVDGAVQPSTSYAMGATAQFEQMDLGINNGASIIANYDDVAYSATATDFPIGNGRVVALRPSALGAGGNASLFGPGASASWASALADDPLDSTAAYLAQTAIVDSSADHVAFELDEPTATAAARAVRGIVAYGATAAGTNDLAVRLRRPGDTLAGSPTIYDGDMEQATLDYGAAIIPPPVGGWTPAALGASQLLVGFSTDVGPAPRVHGALLEVEYR